VDDESLFLGNEEQDQLRELKLMEETKRMIGPILNYSVFVANNVTRGDYLSARR